MGSNFPGKSSRKSIFFPIVLKVKTKGYYAARKLYKLFYFGLVISNEPFVADSDTALFTKGEETL